MAQEMVSREGREVPARGDGGTFPMRRGVFRPRTDIYETADSVMLMADMPGVGPDDVTVNYERGVLTIRGRTPDHPHEGYRQVYAEYAEGEFERAFTLSESIDPDGIRATQKDGVLILELPKAEAAKPRKIQVKTT